MPDDMPMKSMAGRVSAPLRPSVTCVISSLLAMGWSARADVRAIADSGGWVGPPTNTHSSTRARNGHANRLATERGPAGARAGVAIRLVSRWGS